MDEYYKLKYLEYKLKYLTLKNSQNGGLLFNVPSREAIAKRAQVAALFKKLAFWKENKSNPVLYKENNALTNSSVNISHNNECRSAKLNINDCKDTSTANLQKLLDSLDPVNNNGCKENTIIKAQICINLRENAIKKAEAESEAIKKAEAEYNAKIEARALAAEATAKEDARKNAEEKVRQLIAEGRQFRSSSPPSSPTAPTSLPPLRGQLPKPLAPSVASIATRQKMYHM